MIQFNITIKRYKKNSELTFLLIALTLYENK